MRPGRLGVPSTLPLSAEPAEGPAPAPRQPVLDVEPERLAILLGYNDLSQETLLKSQPWESISSRYDSEASASW